MARYGYDEFADYNQVHAQAKAMADARDEAMEMDRRRRVKEENLAAFDAAREQERNPRSMVTATAFDGNGMRRDYIGGRLVGEMPLDDQARIGADFDDLAMRSAAIKRHNSQIERDTVSALMRQARKNGGMVPQNLVDQASANFGMDGKNRAVFRAGYLPNGDFGIDVAERGANGAVQRSTRRIPVADQYSIVNGTPGIWGDDGIAESASLYGQLRNTRGKSTLPADTYRQNLAAYRQGVSAREQQQANAQMDKLMFDIVRDSIKGSGGNGGGKNYRLNAAMKLLTDKNARSWLMQGLEKKDDDGNVVTNGEDEMGNPIPVIDQDKLMQRIDGVIDRYSQQNGSANNALPEWVMKFLDQRFGPRQLSPEEAEIRQRQRQNALDDQRRADVMRGRDQQLIHYLDENGTHKVGSGYVVDGKVYDGDGNEMSGVRLADRNGRPLRDEIDERLAQRASARAQGGGGLAGTPAADVVSGGGGQPQYGLRNDGKTYKGTGWLGELKLPNGGVATEYTMQSDAVRGPDGNRIDFPTLVPTLTKAEQDLMVNDIIPNQKPVPDEIAQKAVDFAKMRLANGQSVFANDGKPPVQEQEVRQNDDEERKRLETERERLLAAKEARAKSRNAARTAAKAQGLMKSSSTLAQETIGTNSNMNRIAENTSAAFRQTEHNYDEMPMTPEERRANAISNLKRWRAASGRENEISDEEIEKMADEELKKQM